MRRVATLLRALLCLVLLTNGVAYAHATTRMATMEANPAGQADDATDVPPCHDAMDMADVALADAKSSQHAGDEGDDPLPECCHSGACDGFCSLHAPAVALPGSMESVSPARTEAPAYHVDLHASARLSHRHRPPILSA